jgi:phosphoheptose isomerase
MITTHFKNYINQLQHALWTINAQEVDNAVNLIEKTIKTGGIIYVCGNGGSAAIANHLTCDCMKGISTNTNLQPRIVSLVSNVPLITAISNDIGFNCIFLYQLKKLMKKNDILITISSSGNSPNICLALDYCKMNGFKSIAFSGFDGGASLAADIPIHVESKNYGIVEDCHQSIMHMIAQYIRAKNLEDGVDKNSVVY